MRFNVSQTGGQALTKHVEYSYDADSQLIEIRRFDGTGTSPDISTTLTWDADNRVSTIGHSGIAGGIAQYGFTWDAAGRLVSSRARHQQ